MKKIPVEIEKGVHIFQYFSNAIYVGESNSGKCEGFGKLIYSQVDGESEIEWMIGKFKANEIDSKYPVTIQFRNSDKYHGYINRDREFDGYGEYQTKEGEEIYLGQFARGKRQGYGKETSKGLIFTGIFENDLKHGNGVMIFKDDKTKIIGNWVKDTIHTKVAKIEYSSGDIYLGEVKNGVIHGKGVYRYSNGNIYEGDFSFKRKQGKGVLKQYNHDTKSYNVIYSGGFEEDLYNGHGILVNSGIDYYIGQFQRGKRHGIGEHHILTTNKYFFGPFKNDKPILTDVNNNKNEYRDNLEKRYYIQCQLKPNYVISTKLKIVPKTGNRKEHFFFDNSVLKSVSLNLVIELLRTSSPIDLCLTQERLFGGSSQSWFYNGSRFISGYDSKTYLSIVVSSSFTPSSSSSKIGKKQQHDNKNNKTGVEITEFRLVRIDTHPIFPITNGSKRYIIKSTYYNKFLSCIYDSKNGNFQIILKKQIGDKKGGGRDCVWWFENGKLINEKNNVEIIYDKEKREFVLEKCQTTFLTLMRRGKGNRDDILFDGKLFIVKREVVLAACQDDRVTLRKWRIRAMTYENSFWEIDNY